MDLNIFKRNLEITTAKATASVASAVALSMSLLLCLPALAVNDNSRRPTVRPLATQPVGARNYVADQIIVMPNKGLAKEDLEQSIKDIDGTIVQKDLLGLAYLVEVPKEKLEVELKKAQKDKHFHGAQKNMCSHATTTALIVPGTGTPIPNDPGFPQQYYLGALNIPSAWALGATGAGIVYGSLDTGVDFTGNPDMQGRTTGLLGGFGYQSFLNLPNGADEDITFGHGTDTTNCFGASTNNGFGFASPCFNSSIIPVSIVGAKKFSGQDPLSATDFSIGNGIEFLMLNNCKLANLSFNQDPPGTFADFYFHPLLQELCAIFAARGGVIFNAAGNAGTPDGIGQISPGLVVVSSVDPTLQPSTFTVWGPATQFAAPGENIAQTAVGGIAYVASGTSASSPLAAGVAGQIASVNPGLTMSQVIQIMAATCQHPANSQGQFKLFYGYGVPDAAAGVRMAQTSF